MIDPIVYAGAAVTVIAALSGGVVSVINALGTIRKKTDAIIEKATQIHDLANSQLTSVTSSLAIANEKIVGLEKLVAAMVEGGTSRAKKLDQIESISKDSNGILHKKPGTKA